MRRRSSFRFVGFFLILAILFLSIRSPLLAQGPAVVLHEVKVDSFPTTNVIVSAWNGSQAIPNLGAENFTLVEDGQIVPIEEVMSLDGSQVPISLILVLDTSTSMQVNNAIDNAKAAALEILDRLKPNDRVALLAFGGQIDLNVLDPTRELAFTTDKEQVRALIAGLQANGSTPLHDAIVKGIRLSANEARGSRAMILLSDGRDEAIADDGQLLPASVLSADDAINEARQGDDSMPVFTIGLGDSIDQPFLERLADQSGGRFAETPTPDQLNLLFNEALNDLLQRYVIRYQSKASADGLNHALQVQLNNNQQTSSAQKTFMTPLLDQPTIGFDLQENQQVQGDVTIQPTISPPNGIVNVQLLVDGEVVDETNAEPYTLTWRSGEERWLQPPNHRVAVQVTYENGNVSQQSVSLIVAQPIPANGGDGANPAEEANSGDGANPAEEANSGDGANPAEEANSGDGANPAEEANSGDGANPAEEAGNNASPEENDSSSFTATVVDFLSDNWLPLFLLGIAALLLSGVLFIWRQDRKRSTYNVDNHPLPPPPIPEPFVSSAPEPSQSFSQAPFVPTPAHADADPYAHADADPYAHAHADADADADADPYAGADADADADLYNQNTALDSSQSIEITSVTTNLTNDRDIEPTVLLLPKGSLTVIEGIDKGNSFDLLEEKMTIGRGGRGIEVQIALSDRTVSRTQAVIKIENQEYFLYNLSKSNLTRLNGQQIKGRMRLRDGDQIEMGKTTLQFIDS